MLYTEKTKTSRFGIASIEWQIPESAKLGTYRIKELKDDNNELWRDSTQFKVSLYQLPTFVVTTHSDNTFYLPTQSTAEITVQGTYLFGKPVPNGKVRIVKETERGMEQRETEMGSSGEAVYEGTADASGKYTATVDLNKAHIALKESENKFNDVTFSADLPIDVSSNKTEQRRFDIRVSNEPYHIHVTEKGRGDHNPKLPLTLYFWTGAADGTALPCNVEIIGKYEDETDDKLKSLTKIRTNSMGVGKVELRIPKREDDVYYEDLDLRFTAVDDTGRSGTEKKEIDIDEDEKQIFIQTNKAIYRKGEPIKARIISTQSDETAFIDLAGKAGS